MSVSPDDPRLSFVSLEDLAVPPEGFVDCQKDRYWMVHPERGAVLYRIGKRGPLKSQANANETVTKQIRDKHYPWAEVRLIPLAFIRININDYI